MSNLLLAAYIIRIYLCSSYHTPTDLKGPLVGHYYYEQISTYCFFQMNYVRHLSQIFCVANLCYVEDVCIIFYIKSMLHVWMCVCG